MTSPDTPSLRSPADLLADPFVHEQGGAWPAWAELRALPGLAWTREAEGPGFWSVTRHADAGAVLGDPGRFSSVPGTTLEGDRWQDDPAAGRMLPLMDPPLHAQVRRLLAGEFTAGRAAALATACRAEIERRAEQAGEEGMVEMDAAFGADLPRRFTLALLGIPQADAAGLDPVIAGTLSCDETDRAIADADLLLYLHDLVESRRRTPGDDLVSRLCALPALAAALPGDAFLLTLANLMSAGLTTTRLAINGAFEALARNPGQWRILCRTPGLRKSAVEEALRWTSPALAVVRTATAPTMLAGTRVAAGARLAVWLPSANRDAAAFHDPGLFRIGRAPNPHLGFGSGIHRCLGMALARLEIGLLLEVTASRWAELAPAGEPLRFRSLVLQGIDRVRIAVSRP